MRVIKLAISAIIVILLVMFAFQNFESVTIVFYKWSITMPLAITVLAIYTLGMLTGGILWSGLKKLAKKGK